VVHERLVDRDGPDHDLVVRLGRASNRLLASRGAVSDVAANALRTVRDLGLEGTGASGYVAIGPGWAGVQAANTRQVRASLVAQGVAAAEVDRFLEVLADPGTVVGSSVLISTWGRRPTGA
jgi:hypothetical protein